ncbi:GNAT family N-acetyltransferase [Pontibacter sp. E15-1]|uniref:GNAT family N-acetyltransferase n=1 Tax=Pontibacter sp. E15-1 TaxID=2919918 RepID=UPI001F4FB2A5|nr:GNAT family N-acetyltransferase [Pontibacter sp. E15-1]MCJ8163856.1 GNAT family N-acetyltransferase [Pontibacter sp. E15-1]
MHSLHAAFYRQNLIFVYTQRFCAYPFRVARHTPIIMTHKPSALPEAAFAVQEIRGLEPMLAQYRLVQQLNPSMPKERYKELLQQMLPSGYRMVGAFNEAGACVGLSGFWVGTKLYSGKYLEPDNFVVDAAYRSAGVGKLLSDWMLEEAQRLHCDTVMLDAYVTNGPAHRFYFREGFHVKSFHFFKSL